MSAAHTAAARTAPPAPASYVWLGPGWRAWLVLGPDDSPDAFRRAARRLRDEFGGVVAAAPSPDEGAEHAEVRVGPALLLLARRPGSGVSLGADWTDLPVLLRIAAAHGAAPWGWRWIVYRLLRGVGRAELIAPAATRRPAASASTARNAGP
jgi:hypothetical protein